MVPSVADELPLIGRRVLVDAAVRSIADRPERVLTLTGRHGVGTTRVALSVAERLPGPHHVVRLAAADDPAEYLARALDVLAVEARSAVGVVSRLREVGGVVVLDGCRAVDVARKAVHQLLEHVAGLTVVLTAPAALGLPGEVALPVPALPVPPAGETDPGVIARTPAVELFLAAAARAAPGSPLAEGDLSIVAEVCRRLDGLPLALVTAAARLSIMQPLAMLHEMQRLGAWELVGLSVEDEVERTLALLDEPVQRVARALAVMTGGADVRGLAAVAGAPESDVVRGLVMLVELQLATADVARARYEPTSSAAACLRHRHEGSEAWSACLDRHLEHFREQARAFARRPHGSPMDPAWLLDHPNRLAALSRARQLGDRSAALRLAVDCMPGFEHRGEPDAGRQLLAEVLNESPESTSGACISAHLWLGRLEAERADGVSTSGARDHFATASRLARERDHLVLRLEALNALAENQVVLEGGVELCELAVAEGLGLTADDGLEIGRAVFLGWHSANLHRRGRLDEAVGAICQALEIARRWGDLRLVMSLSIFFWQLPTAVRAGIGGAATTSEMLEMATVQGDVRAKGWIQMVVVGNALDDGDVGHAVPGVLDMLRLSRRTQQRPLARQALVATVRLLGRHPDPELACLLGGVLARHEEGVRAHLAPRWTSDLELSLTRARGLLGPVDSEAAQRRGSQLPLWEALDLAERWLLRLTHDVRSSVFGDRPGPEQARPLPGARTGRTGADDDRSPLTARECEVLTALATGRSNKEIARVLGVRPKTVEHHCAAIYAKLGVRSRAGAVSAAFGHGWLAAPERP